MCLGYFDEEKFGAMTQAERNAFMDACFAYDAVLRAKGHFLSGEGLESARTATTVRLKNGKPLVTDGPFIESKEVVGGFALLQANSKEEAIKLAKDFLQVAGEGECEIRQLYEMGETNCTEKAAKA